MRIYERIDEEGNLTGLRCPFYQHGKKPICKSSVGASTEYQNCITIDTKFHDIK
jgi:hypothetical protein